MRCQQKHLLQWFFSILADECTDASNKEQLVVCIKWVDELLQDHENVIGMYNVGTIDAKTLTDALEDVLLRAGLKIHNCRGQCYDGAANMSGSKTGVQSHFLQREPQALSPIVMGTPSTLLLVMHLKTIKCVGMP